MGMKPRMGRPPKPGGPYRGFALRLPEQLHARIRKIAKRHSVAMNDLIIQAVQDWCDAHTEGKR